MKPLPSSVAKKKLNSAFAKINSAHGQELNEIVSTIEQFGKKKKIGYKRRGKQIHAKKKNLAAA